MTSEEVQKMAATMVAQVLQKVAEAVQQPIAGLIIPYKCTGIEFECGGKYNCAGDEAHSCAGAFKCTGTFTFPTVVDQ
jgi:hypothetical protein